MTKPIGGIPMRDSHFKFLSSTSRGKGNLNFTTEEAKRFVSMGKKLVQCANWNKKVDREIFVKVIKVIESAHHEADNNCETLPFSLPDESPDFRVPMRAPDFGRGV